ncbi:MAG: hypothetical protein A2126_01010 [Candidatus Woykebacteria bacterium GWB1_45_5]|uniref:HTH cro/C1-type domain-containing protein n=2 Tax=Candidatus Woykeibacteriota TaxID=1817899 RepID=A0A1G1W2T7_9BACT|nr:MAG: hypothetical protein A2113_01315 [Candidatus Woykebacteria bacterium GWA1_44_8]OGY23989.1 MAG: hypothetical protein A2126_01010 [Candidatus Woykebacteria bacterium GWB1_45_5]
MRKNKIKLIPFEKIERRWAKNPTIQKVYEELEPEYQLVKSLIEIRVKKNLSQEELAEKVGMKQPVISRIESMHSLPSVATLKKISKALGEPLLIRFGSR